MLVEIAAIAHRWFAPFVAEAVAVVPILDGRVGAISIVAVGIADSVDIVPSTVLRIALAHGAESVVLVHNHLDDRAPSDQDLAVTRRLVAAGAVVGLPLRGHLVVTPRGWYDCFDESRTSTRWPAVAAA